MSQAQGLFEAWTLSKRGGDWSLSRAILSLPNKDGAPITKYVLEDFFGDATLTPEENALEATRRLLREHLRRSSGLGILSIASANMPENIYRNHDLWPDWIGANKRAVELYSTVL